MASRRQGLLLDDRHVSGCRTHVENINLMDHLLQIILLLTVAVAAMVIFQRLHIPSSLGYLLVGLLLGPHTMGPNVHVPEFKVLAEFGVVFLLFSIGLNYSLPQLHAMRHQILGLGTAQVVLTTAADTLS